MLESVRNEGKSGENFEFLLIFYLYEASRSKKSEARANTWDSRGGRHTQLDAPSSADLLAAQESLR